MDYATMDMCCAVQVTKISNRYVPYSLFCEDCLDEIYLSCLSIITVLAGKSVGCCSKNGVEKKRKTKGDGVARTRTGDLQCVRLT